MTNRPSGSSLDDWSDIPSEAEYSKAFDDLREWVGRAKARPIPRRRRARRRSETGALSRGGPPKRAPSVLGESLPGPFRWYM